VSIGNRDDEVTRNAPSTLQDILRSSIEIASERLAAWLVKTEKRRDSCAIHQFFMLSSLSRKAFYREIKAVIPTRQ